MTKTRILSLIQEGEGLRIEFKECKRKLPKNVYETVCAFLNRNIYQTPFILRIQSKGHNGQVSGIKSFGRLLPIF